MCELTTLPPREKQQIKTPEKDPIVTTPEKPQPLGPTESTMVKKIEAMGGPQTPNPDKTFATIQLDASRKTFVEAGYGVKGMLTNTEQQQKSKEEYTQALHKMRELKMEELRKQIASENPDLQ